MLLAEAMLGGQSGLNSIKSIGRRLAESDMWKPYLEDMDESRDGGILKSHTAVMLENCRRWAEGLEETTRAIQIGDFQKYSFPLIRAIFPELVSQRLVSVQPMLGPVSQVFYMDFIYGSNKGNITRGSKMFDSVALGTSNPDYSSPLVDEEQIATGTGSASTYTGNFAHIPVRSLTITITDGTQVVQDDGNGNLVGNVTAGSNTINYQTGAFSFKFANATTLNTPITSSYEYDFEAQTDIPEVDLNLTSSPVMARPRKLKTRWSLESAFNLRSLHGLEAEVELTSAVGAELRFEIDREIIKDLTTIVPAANQAPIWSKSKLFNDTDPYAGPPSGAATTVGLTEQYLSFTNQLVVGANQILQSTGRAIGSWIVADLTTANVFETLPGFVPTPGLPNGIVKGVYEAGTLNGRWTIFKDPFFNVEPTTPSKVGWLMGYKGTSFLEAGYVYAPYIPLYTTPMIVLDDFIGRKGMATQYGKKVVNARFYGKGQISA